MPRTGQFGGFDFDPEVFTDYMSEQPTWKNAIIQSGVIVTDNRISQAVGSKGNVGTIPFYKPIDINDYEPKNYDGFTDNTPSEISGGKQTFVVTRRMNAWQSKDFTSEITGADPLGHVASSVTNYYQQLWQHILTGMMKTIMSITKMKNHIADVTSGTTTFDNTNKISNEALIYLKQSANGDMQTEGNLIFMHSMVEARLRELKLIDYDKYTVANAMTGSTRIGAIGNDIIVVDDRGNTVDLTGDSPIYNTYIVGRGAFLQADITLENPYTTEFNPEKFGGIEMLYTKQAKCIHPNGFDFDVSAMAQESPEDTELFDKNNWDLKLNEKNIQIAMLKSNG